ncbi:MAG: glucosamine-6-phosphate deaminase [Ginsengibacter sp.]
MKIFISDTYDKMSVKAFNDIISLLPTDRNPLLCTASGDTPTGLYKELIRQSSSRKPDMFNWNFVGLDEWVGMNGTDEGSCRYHLDRQLFHRLKTRESQICFFDGRAKDPVTECEHVEKYITKLGGIDVAIIGLGLNGHVGMNEPGTPAKLRAHLTAIDPVTQQSAQKYFKEPKEITHGLTLGIADLLDAKHIILLISGEKKAGIARQILESGISEKLPATLLRDHPGMRIYLDAAAGNEIKNSGIVNG